ncbi:granzyme D-like [Fopius arisanus]|uniref:Granzyme D-like n=1 Tax=Fopius arisanus TaxID=64838 RepID=A0A9R1TCX6_9HYME|nr:PREDICTED: granzyme D-like [Fopius arisanus]
MSSLLIGSLLILTAIFHGGHAILDGFAAYQYVAYMAQITKVYPVCAGTIISTTHILTSAQCIYNYDPSELTIIARDSQIILLKFIIIHPKYRPFHGQTSTDYYSESDNVAVIKLQRDIILHHRVKVLKVVDDEIRPNYALCSIAGPGQTQMNAPYSPYNGWNWSYLEILPAARCEQLLRKHRPEEFCANAFMNRLPFKGDEGSSLVCDGQLVGIYTAPFDSEMEKPYFTQLPVIFMKVSAYYSFITSAMEISEIEKFDETFLWQLNSTQRPTE